MSGWLTGVPTMTQRLKVAKTKEMIIDFRKNKTCLLYTSDAADES